MTGIDRKGSDLENKVGKLASRRRGEITVSSGKKQRGPLVK